MENSEKKFEGEEQIHNNRCEGDSIYRLCFFPGDDDQGEPFDLKLLNRCIAFVYKKYGKALRDDSIITQVVQHMHTYEDHDARFVAISCIMAWEPEIAEVLERALVPEKAPFGNRCREQHRKYVSMLHAYTGHLIQMPFNPTNAKQIVMDFKLACVQEYWTGPHTTNVNPSGK